MTPINDPIVNNISDMLTFSLLTNKQVRNKVAMGLKFFIIPRKVSDTYLTMEY
jgi:hypothetical protein